MTTLRKLPIAAPISAPRAVDQAGNINCLVRTNQIPVLAVVRVQGWSGSGFQQSLERDRRREETVPRIGSAQPRSNRFDGELIRMMHVTQRRPSDGARHG